MLVHCVFLKVKPDVSDDAITEIMEGLKALVAEVDGMRELWLGPNRDFEQKSQDFKHGFVCLFDDREAHLSYERHPRHVELGGQLVDSCVGGADGIVVYDIEAP